jgi:hypothetical protein
MEFKETLANGPCVGGAIRPFYETQNDHHPTLSLCLSSPCKAGEVNYSTRGLQRWFL